MFIFLNGVAGGLLAAFTMLRLVFNRRIKLVKKKTIRDVKSFFILICIKKNLSNLVSRILTERNEMTLQHCIVLLCFGKMVGLHRGHFREYSTLFVPVYYKYISNQNLRRIFC